MMSNSLKLIIRDFRRNKVFSFIKIGGFAFGIASCFLIALFVRHELSYDKHYKNGDRIYRVLLLNNSRDTRGIHLQEPFAEALITEFPEIELAGRICPVEIFGAGENSIRRSDSKINYLENNFMFADQAFLDILEVPFIRGDRNTALTEPNSIVIRKAVAEKLFPNEDPLGKILIQNERIKTPLKITGIIDDFPGNTHIKLNYLIAFYPNMFGQQSCWSCYNYCTYVRVKKGTDIARLENKLKLIPEKYRLPYDKLRGFINAEERAKNTSYELQPVKDIHLESADISQPMGHDYGDLRLIWILGAIALFVLIIACINFINLSTAKSAGRAKEMAMKKTIGARRIKLIQQIFAESVFYCLLSILLAVIITWFLLPYFNQLSHKALTIPWKEWWFFPIILLSALSIGAFAGIYPSLYLTSFNTVKALTGKREGAKNAGFRNGLVVFQFAASIILIVCTIAIYRQVNYFLNKDIGFNKEQVVLIRGTNTLGKRIEILKNELKKLADVESVSNSSYLPYEGTSRNGNGFWKEGRSKLDPSVQGQNWIVDEGYLQTLGLKLKQGRNFSTDMNSDRQSACIINQEMAKQFGFDNPIGERIVNGGNGWEIIGVVEDFNYDLMNQNIMPLLMQFGVDNQITLIRVKTSDMASAMKSIKMVWSDVTQNQPLNYSFLDSQFGNMYDGVQRMGKIFRSFALLAIIVACLGLYGLAEYITKERTKEVGIRKVNGARIIEILLMLNSGFVIWVIIAFVIATPIAYYAMNKWIESFAYKTELSWWIFAMAGAMALGIALLTVSWQSWRAATRNPVEALRYE
jgi:putative ABC transport system permease protein